MISSGVSLLVALVLSAPESSTNRSIKDWRIEVEHGAPEVAYPIVVTVAAAGAKTVRAVVTQLSQKDRGTVPAAKLCLTAREPRRAGAPCAMETAQQNVADGVGEITFYLEPKVGKASPAEYQAELVVSGAGLQTPLRRTLQVVVTDGPLFPAIVILGGVLAGAVVNFLAGRFRTQQQLALRIERLRRAVDAWRRRSPNPNQALDALEQAVTDAESDNAAFLLDDTALKKIEGTAEQYRADQFKRSEDLRKRIKGLGPSPANPAEVAQAEQMLREGRLDEAEAILDSLAAPRVTAAQWLGTARRALAFLGTPTGRLRAAGLGIVLISIIVATCSGMLALYAPPFGSLGQYLTAFLWGFGIDSGIRGFRATFQKLDIA